MNKEVWTYEMGILHYMQDWRFNISMCLLTLGILLSTLLMRFGLFTGVSLALYTYVFLGILVYEQIIPYSIIENHPYLEWAVLLLVPIGMALEHLKIFSLRPLTTLPLTTLPPYATTTQAFIQNPELIFLLPLIGIIAIVLITRKTKG
jgi:hypothetical protein